MNKIRLVFGDWSNDGHGEIGWEDLGYDICKKCNGSGISSYD